MSATTLVSVEEYLRTSYPDGDREYVDGRIVERNLGTTKHAWWQAKLMFYLMANYKDVWAVSEVRVQVKPTRFRIPDVTCGLNPYPETPAIQEPPFLAVEILSPDDRVGELEEKIDDYLAFGIGYIWVVNPVTRRGFVYTADGMHEAKDGILRTGNPEIAVPLDAI